MYFRHLCIDNFKTRSSSLHDNNADRWKTNDVPTSGSSLWTPEFYDGPDGYKKDFITSNYDDKYSNNSPFYNSKTRPGFCTFTPAPFSSGNVYTSSGYHDRKPVYGLARPIDYGVHDYENSYDYGHGGYGLSHPFGSKILKAC
uniref:Uncharacterized protein n=1 Tax=Anopheles maculatus TaxID=74869 RepID=A0A182SJ99_9DIPT